jgi:hypothetical protein
MERQPKEWRGTKKPAILLWNYALAGLDVAVAGGINENIIPMYWDTPLYAVVDWKGYHGSR